MKAKVVRSLGEYFETVRRIRGRWKVAKRYELWFRAEDAAHKETRLQPGIYRPRESGRRKSVKRLLALENELYEEFRRCASQLSDIRPNDEEEWEWDSYFLMQHHGVPTRLLDWSDGALIALHFAVRDKPIPPRTGSIIYILDPYWLLEHLDKEPDRKGAQGRWKKYCDKHPHDTEESDWDRLYLPYDDDDEPDPLLTTPEIPLLWDSPHLSRRVAAQRSRFMIFGSNPYVACRFGKEKRFSLGINHHSSWFNKPDKAGAPGRGDYGICCVPRLRRSGSRTEAGLESQDLGKKREFDFVGPRGHSATLV